MKKLYTLFVWALLFNQAYAMSAPEFISNLKADKSHICPAGSVKISARVSGADSYQFQLRDGNQDWQDVPGASGDPSNTSGIVTLDLFNVSSPLFYRLVILQTGTQQVRYSDELYIYPQQPLITVNPAAQVQCNGLNVEFKTAATSPTTLLYQWQISKDAGTTFSDLAPSSKIPAVTNPSLKVNNLANADHESMFRCKITDQGACVVYTSNANLLVNQLSTAVQPALSRQFCEGEQAAFFPASVVGEVEAYQWSLKPSTSSSYAPLSESPRFIGVASDTLVVKGLRLTENSYQVKVTFKNALQGAGENMIMGTCSKTAARSSYVIHPRPSRPASIADIERCGAGRIVVDIPGTIQAYYWYADTTVAPLASGNLFTSPVIQQTMPFYVSFKDAKGCESYKTPFQAIVKPKPSFLVKSGYEICPADQKLTIVPDSVTAAPNQFNIVAGPNKLPGFTPLLNQPYFLFSSVNADLPAEKPSGHFDFYVHLKNTLTTCTSDSVKINLRVKINTAILMHPASQSICESGTAIFRVQASGEGSLKYQWLKNGIPVNGDTSNVMILNNIVKNDAAEYTCDVSGECGRLVSEKAVLMVLPLTRIVKNVTAQKVCQGKSAAFTIEATGTGTLHYQWYKNGVRAGNDSSGFTLKNVSDADDQSLIWCEVSGDCGIPLRSDSVRLTVLKTPEPPSFSGNTGYCKGATSQPLPVTYLAGHSLVWYSSDDPAASPAFTAPLPSTANVGQQHFYVSQRDSLLCESNRIKITIRVSSPITLEMYSSTNALCATGYLNREGLLGVLTRPEIETGDSLSYLWMQNSVLIPDETKQELAVYESGTYTVKVKKGYCAAETQLIIKPLLPELNAIPEAADQEICAGKPAILLASGNFSGGNFRWWDSEKGTIQISDQNPFVANNISTPAVFYASYIKTSGFITCESPRKKVRISVKKSPAITFTTKNVSCAGKSDGKITIHIPGDSAVYQFSINNGPFQDKAEFDLLTAGSYLITVKDDQGCEHSETVELPANPGPKITLQPVSITKCAGNTANFTLKGMDFTSIIWQRQLPGGSFTDIPGENSLTLKLTSAGNAVNPHLSQYRAILTTGTCSVTSETAQLLVNSKNKNLESQEICSGERVIFSCPETTGLIQSYQWQRRAGSTGSFIDIPGGISGNLIIEKAGAGDHNNYFRCKLTFINPDQTTCSITTDDARLSVSLVDLQYTKEDISCFGRQNGKITANASAGKSPYTFRLDRSSWQSGATFSGLAKGTYILEARDAGGCVVSDTIEISEPEDFKISIWKTSLKCSEDQDAMARVEISDSTGTGYSYLWSNGSTEPEISGLRSGSYFVTVKNSKGCIKTDSVEILPVKPFGILSFTTLQPECGVANGRITISVEPASDFIEYKIGNAQYVSSGVFDRLSSGTYLVKARNKAGCELAQSISLKDTNRIQAIRLTAINPTCGEAADGSIQAKAICTGCSPEYKVNEQPFSLSPVFTGLKQGYYRITVKDAGGCTLTIDTTLVSDSLPQISVQPSDQSDCKGNSAEFNVKAGNYTGIQWQKKLPGGTFEDISGETGLKLAVPSVGSMADPDQTLYKVKIANKNCAVLSDEVVLSVNSVTGSLSSRAICEGQDTGFNLQELQISGKVSSYQWQFRPGSSGAWQPVQNVNDSVLPLLKCTKEQQGYYRCRIIFANADGSSCTLYSSVNGTKLTVNELQFPVMSGDTVLCSPQKIRLVATGCTGTVKWSDGSTGSVVFVNPVTDTWYKASCQANGCETWSKDSLSVKIKAPDLLAPTIKTDKNMLCKGGDFILTASGCQGIVVWSNGQTGLIISIKTEKIISVTAQCKREDCMSPQSNSVELQPAGELKPGEITTTSAVQCSGYNPPEILSKISPSGGINPSMQWEASETCSSVQSEWHEIPGAASLTYNPSTLLKTTCYRRKLSDSCQTIVYSNIVRVEVLPDPGIKIASSKSTICKNDTLILTALKTGGAGQCILTWQKNERSGAESSQYWETISGSDSLLLLAGLQNRGIADKTIFFRAVYSCDLSSCNRSVSASVGIIVKSTLDLIQNFKDSTVCSGNPADLVVNGCGGPLKWSTGETSPTIRVYPAITQVYSAVCSSDCEERVIDFNIKVRDGLPVPLNTTPTAVIQPAVLTFSGSGQNLRWYTSATETQGSAQAPQHADTGIYNYWLSQSDGFCESQRLKISARVYPALTITQQPADQVNCNGLMVTFQTIATGAGKLTYEWQRKRPGEPDFIMLDDQMEDIKQPNTSTLKIYSSGNSENPHLSEFRCLIRDSVSVLTTEVKKLVVNSLKGSLPNYKVCVGLPFSIDLKNNFQITGDVISYQWQYRYGTSDDWLDMTDTNKISGTKTHKLVFQEIQSWYAPRYRCKVTFNTMGLVCSETTDQTTLTIGEVPGALQNHTFEFCQFEKVTKLDINLPKENDAIWYPDQQASSGWDKMPQINTSQQGEQHFFVSQVTATGCESKKAEIIIMVHPEPPAPKNTTPLFVFEGQMLTFSAEGISLKWFTSRTGKNFQSEAPEYQAVKTYKHFVSQTSVHNCESERTEITSEIRPSPGLTTQPKSQADCEGNSVTFSVRTKGEETAEYQWQRKRTGEPLFTNLPGETLRDLKIAKAGSTDHPHLSQYRCLIKDSRSELLSDIATLTVNEIKNAMPDIQVCDNQFITIDGKKLGVTGNPALVEWQRKEGSAYRTVFESENLRLNDSLSATNQGDYRLKINFITEGKNTCSRNTNTFKLKVNPSPASFGNTRLEICQYENIEKALTKSLQTVWYKGLDDTVKTINFPPVNSDSVYQQVFYASNTNEWSCESPRSPVLVSIKAAPKPPLMSSLINYCQFSDNEPIKTDSELPLLWYHGKEAQASTSPFVPETTKEGIFRYAVTLKDTNGCESSKQIVEVNIQACYYTYANNEDCRELRLNDVKGNEWHYFRDNLARIVAAINSQDQDVGDIALNFRLTAKPLVTKGGTSYIPRYYHLSSSKASAFEKPLLIKVFLSDQELLEYAAEMHMDNPAKSPFSVVNYTGVREDCQLLNNDNFENGISSVLQNAALPEKVNEHFYAFEFPVSQSGEFGLTGNSFSASELRGIPEPGHKTALSWNNRNEVRPLKYTLFKSGDNIKWFRSDEIPVNDKEYAHTDNTPFSNQTFYRLLYTDIDGTVKMLNTIKVTHPEEKPGCFVFPNPVISENRIDMYLSNFDVNSIRVTDSPGKELPVRSFGQIDAHIQIELNHQLTNGVYFITAFDKDGKKCVSRFVK